MEKDIFKTETVAETEALGAKLARRLSGGDRYFFVALEGDLGAGKTAFCRGVASVVSPGSRVKSPSYTIVNEYRLGDTPLFHFDLYRLGEDCDLSEIGFSEYIESGHCILEWSEYLENRPDNTVVVRITKDGEECRTVEITYPDDSDK